MATKDYSISLGWVIYIAAIVCIAVGGLIGYLAAPDAEPMNTTGYVTEAKYTALLTTNEELTNASTYWKGQFDALNTSDVAEVLREANVTSEAKAAFEEDYLAELDLDTEAHEDNYFNIAYLSIDLDEDEGDYEVEMSVLLLEFNDNHILQETYYVDSSMVVRDDNAVRQLSIDFALV